MQTLLLLLMTGVGALARASSAEIPSNQQGDASFENALRQHLQSAPGQFNDAQVSQLSKLIVDASAKYPDPAFQSKLRTDAMDYVLSRATSNAFVVANPFDAGGPKTDVFRTEAAMQLFEYELQFRLEEAGDNRKSQETRAACKDQIDALAVRLGGRLTDLVAGPGAQQFVESSVERFKQYLGYLSESDLEFAFRTPLSAEQLRDLGIQLATYTPPESELPQAGADPKRDRGKIWVDDPGKPTYHMNMITDFGLIALAENRLSQIYTPKALYSAKYQSLRSQMRDQYEELRKALAGSNKVVLGKDPEEGWYVSRPASRKTVKSGPDLRAPRESERSSQDSGTGSPAGPGRSVSVVSYLVLAAMGIAALAVALAIVIRRARHSSRPSPGA
jgi:hypothetical protein